MKYWSIIIFLSVSLLSSAQMTDSLQQKLLNKELTFWQAQNDSVRFYALLGKARADRNAGLYRNALKELSRADDYCKTGSEKSELEYEKMINYFLSDRYAECGATEIDSNRAGEHYQEFVTMKLYALNEVGKWQECKDAILKLCPLTDSTRINEIKQLPVSYKYKKPERARHMSAILPGLGEVYAGYPFKGLTSLVVNAAFLAFGGYNFYYSYYVTGAVAGVFPFLRFYSGGKRLSAILADRHNNIEAAKLKVKYREKIGALLQ